MNTFAFDLDLSKDRSPEVVVMRQGDKSGTTIVATLYDHGTKLTSSALSATGLTVNMCMALPDGTHYYRKAGTYADGVITHVVDETYACSVAGRNDNVYFELIQGTESSSPIASTASFTVIVLPSATSGKTEGKDYDDEVRSVIRQWLDEHPEATTTVVDDSLTTAKLKDKSVTEPKLADGAVSMRTIVDANVTTAKLADASVTEAKLASNSVGTAKLKNGSVTTDKLDGDMFSVVTDTQLMAMFG